MNQSHGHDACIQFFAICLSSDVDRIDAVACAQQVNEAAATYGPQADAFWEAVNRGLLGEYAHLRHYGIEVLGDKLELASHNRRVQYRLLTIRKALQPLVADYQGDWLASAKPGRLGGRSDGS